MAFYFKVLISLSVFLFFLRVFVGWRMKHMWLSNCGNYHRCILVVIQIGCEECAVPQRTRTGTCIGILAHTVLSISIVKQINPVIPIASASSSLSLFSFFLASSGWCKFDFFSHMNCHNTISQFYCLLRGFFIHFIFQYLVCDVSV